MTRNLGLSESEVKRRVEEHRERRSMAEASMKSGKQTESPQVWQTNEQTNKQTNEQTDKIEEGDPWHTNEQTNKQTNK